MWSGREAEPEELLSSSPWPSAHLLEGEELPPLFGIGTYRDGCDGKSSGSPGVMARKHPEEEGCVEPTRVVVPPSGL